MGQLHKVFKDSPKDLRRIVTEKMHKDGLNAEEIVVISVEFAYPAWVSVLNLLDPSEKWREHKLTNVTFIEVRKIADIQEGLLQIIPDAASYLEQQPNACEVKTFLFTKESCYFYSLGLSA